MSQPIIKPRKRTIAPSHKVIDHETLVSVLSKPHKTTEEAKTVFEKIVSLSFFKNFFAFYLQDNDMSSIFSLCQTFQYEKFNAHDVILKQKDPSNDKFYVILSGTVGVFIKNDSQDIDNEKEAARRANEKKSLTLLTRAEMRRAAFQRTSKRYNTTIFSGNEGISTISSPKSLGSPRNPRALLSQRTIELSEATPKFESKANTMQQFGFENAIELMEKTNSVCTMTSLGKAKVAAGKLKKTIADNKETKQVTFRTSPHTLQDLDEDSIERDGYNKAKSIGGENGERQEFEKTMKEYGKLIRYMKEGEGFGELALKRNIARTSSVVCRSDCEVLVMNKEQYNQGYGKMHKEKDDLLNSVFPFLMANATSTQNYNYLLYSFKTERYPKGTYIINEGKVEKSTAKFYVIQKGECHVEKQLVKEINDGAQKTVAKAYEKVQVTVSGRGVIIGEEILITGNEYEYSIKAATEMVIVQAISKQDFELKFPKEFHQYIKDIYEKKKNHREAGLAQYRKEKDLRILQYKTENVYCLQHRGIKDFLVKPAIQGFSRYLHRGNKLWDEKDPVLAELHSPLKKKKGVYSLAFDSMIMQNEDQGNAKSDKRSLVLDEENVLSKEKEEKEREVTELLTRFGVSNAEQDNRIKAKIKFINIMTEKNKKKGVNDSSNPFALNLSHIKLESPRNVSLSPTKIVKERSTPADIPVSVEKADILLSKIRVRNQGPVLAKEKFDAELPKSARVEGEVPKSMPRITSQEFESLYNQKLRKGLTKPMTPIFGSKVLKEPKTATSLVSTDLALATAKSDPLNPIALESSPSISSPRKSMLLKLDLDLKKSVSQETRPQTSSIQLLGDIKEGRQVLQSPRLNLEMCFGTGVHSRKGSDILIPISTTSARGEIKTPKPQAQVKTPKSSNDLNSHLREVNQWRQKIFKKPGKTSVQLKMGSLNTCR